MYSKEKVLSKVAYIYTLWSHISTKWSEGDKKSYHSIFFKFSFSTFNKVYQLFTSFLPFLFVHFITAVTFHLTGD